jgi:hypothetical protein
MFENNLTALQFTRAEQELHRFAIQSKRFEVCITFSKDRIMGMPLFDEEKLLYESTNQTEAEEIIRKIMVYARAYRNKCENKEVLSFDTLDEAITGRYIIYIRFDKE